MAKHAAVKPAVPVEHKVIQPTAVSAVLGVVLAALNGLAAGPGVLDALAVPKVYQGLILAVIPPLVVLISGYVAPHSPRPDVEAGAEDVSLGAISLASMASRTEPDAPTCGH